MAGGTRYSALVNSFPRRGHLRFRRSAAGRKGPQAPGSLPLPGQALASPGAAPEAPPPADPLLPSVIPSAGARRRKCQPEGDLSTLRFWRNAPFEMTMGKTYPLHHPVRRRGVRMGTSGCGRPPGGGLAQMCSPVFQRPLGHRAAGGANIGFCSLNSLLPFSSDFAGWKLQA